MASTTQDELYQTFLAVSGQQTSALGDTTAMLANVVAQVDELRSSIPAPVVATKTQGTTTSTSDGGAPTLGSVAASVLESGFGLAPLISGLVSLFTGGDAPAPAPLVKYAMPAVADFQAALSGLERMSPHDEISLGIGRTSLAEAACRPAARLPSFRCSAWLMMIMEARVNMGAATATTAPLTPLAAPMNWTRPSFRDRIGTPWIGSSPC